MDYKEVSRDIKTLKVVSNYMFDRLIESCDTKQLHRDIPVCLKELIDRYSDLYTEITDPGHQTNSK